VYGHFVIDPEKNFAGGGLANGDVPDIGGSLEY
jgi:hypothetical protein